jgi:O-antigen/teichoic acid export membrane protein
MPKEPLFNQIKLLLKWRFIILIIAFINSVILARWLEKEERGALALWMNIIALFTFISSLGIPEASVYFINNLDDKKQTGPLFFTLLLIQYFILTIVIIIVIQHNNINISYLLSFLISYSLITITNFKHLFLTSNSKNLYSKICTTEVVCYSIITLIFSIYFEGKAYIALKGYFLSNILTLIIALVLFNYYFKPKFALYRNLRIIKNSLKKGLSFFFIGIGGFATERTIIFIINYKLGALALANYTIANSISKPLNTALQQICIGVYSTFCETNSKAQHAGNIKSFQKLVKTYYLLGPLIICLFSCGCYFGLSYIYGEKYENLEYIAIILIFNAFLVGLISVYVNYLAAAGKMKFGVIQTYLSVIIFILVILVIHNYIGLLTLAITLSVSNLIGLLYIKKRFNYVLFQSC